MVVIYPKNLAICDLICLDFDKFISSNMFVEYMNDEKAYQNLKNLMEIRRLYKNKNEKFCNDILKIYQFAKISGVIKTVDTPKWCENNYYIFEIEELMKERLDVLEKFDSGDMERCVCTVLIDNCNAIIKKYSIEGV